MLKLKAYKIKKGLYHSSPSIEEVEIEGINDTSVWVVYTLPNGVEQIRRRKRFTNDYSYLKTKAEAKANLLYEANKMIRHHERRIETLKEHKRIIDEL